MKVEQDTNLDKFTLICEGMNNQNKHRQHLGISFWEYKRLRILDSRLSLAMFAALRTFRLGVLFNVRKALVGRLQIFLTNTFLSS